MKANRLSKTELEEVCQIMSIGNAALKKCAEMLGMKHREFRGKLFTGRLDTKKMKPEQVAAIEAAKPLIFRVRDECQEKVRGNFVQLIAQQAWLASRNMHDPKQAKADFMQEGELAVLNGIYGYTDTKIRLCTYIWQCVRRRILDAANHLNPLCPLTNEAIDLVQQVQEIQNADSEITDEQAVQILGFSAEESEVFFRSITKVVNHVTLSVEDHTDDYTANRRGVDRDFHEVYFVKKDARQAVKDADLTEFELACLFGDAFPFHGWKEDVASKHINPRTKERFTRQNVQYALDRAKEKVRKAFLIPPKAHLENPAVDTFFDAWDAERAVKEDQKR